MNLISVIIPVYNVEKSLGRCLDSVVNQTYKNIEIIIVNDGTEDNSEKIIYKYKEKYGNIKYVKKKNGGLSDARNFGIRYATGDYICFLDSDDYLSLNLFENLEKYMTQNIEMINHKVIMADEFCNEVKSIDGPVFGQAKGYEAFNKLYGSDTMLQPAWLYLYKKSFWDNSNFEYPVGKLHEDFAITPLIILNAQSVVSTDVYGYYYVQTQSSITRGNDENKKMQRALDMIEHYDHMIVSLEELKLDKVTKENVKIYYTNCIILKIQELSGENKKLYVKEIRNRKMYKNIKVRNFRQLIKKILLNVNIDLYFKVR